MLIISTNSSMHSQCGRHISATNVSIYKMIKNLSVYKSMRIRMHHGTAVENQCAGVSPPFCVTTIQENWVRKSHPMVPGEPCLSHSTRLQELKGPRIYVYKFRKQILLEPSFRLISVLAGFFNPLI